MNLNPDACDRPRQLHAYHDDELLPSERDEMQEHLAGCAACRAELTALRAASRLVSSVGEAAAPEWLMRRLRRTADAAAEKGIRRLASAVLAVAAAVLVACSVQIWRLSSARQTDRPVARWEQSARGPAETTASDETAEDQLAAWMVQDLSGGGR